MCEHKNTTYEVLGKEDYEGPYVAEICEDCGCILEEAKSVASLVWNFVMPTSIQRYMN